jgi:hypothetical protein
MLGRETASGRIEKSAVLAPCRIRRFRLSSAKVLAGPSGWTAKAMGTVQISATGPNSRHGSYVRPLRDLPAHGTSILIQATRRVAGSPRAPRFTCHKMGCGAIGMPRRPSARAPQRVKQSRIRYNATRQSAPLTHRRTECRRAGRAPARRASAARLRGRPAASPVAAADSGQRRSAHRRRAARIRRPPGCAPGRG